MHRGVVAVAVLLLSAGAVLGAPAAGAPAAGPEQRPHPAQQPQQAQPAQQVAPQTTPDGFDSTVFAITVYDNRSARWTLRYVSLLENDSQVETFETFAADFESSESDLERSFRSRAQRLTAFGSNATGREMTATDFRKRAYTEPEPGGAQARGVVELSFRWSGFARAEGDRVIVDDVFEGGMYVGPDQRLVFAHGPNLVFADVEPEPDAVSGGSLAASESVTWFGERTYATQRPRVRFAPSGSTGDGSDGRQDTVVVTGTEADPAGAGGPPGAWFVALLVILFLGAGGGVAWYTGNLPSEIGGAGAGSGVGTSDSGPDAGSGPSASGETASVGGAGGVAGEAAGADAGADITEEDLLSDEDRVLRLLDENDGRMKQVRIVEETGWSKSKVSMLLSDMEEEDQISKLRVGRENIISRAGEEPDAAGSPFDEE